MAIVTMPATLPCGRGCRIEQITTDAVSVSDPAGNSQARSYGVPRWALSLVSPATLNDAGAGAWKALLLGLRGSVNYLAAYDPSRPVPRGTLRGTLTLLADAAYGDNSLTLDCGLAQSGKTLAAGDWLQLGTGLGSSQLVLCVADAIVDGSGHLGLSFEAPLRLALPAATPVAWDHPVGYFRRPAGRAGWAPYSGLHTQGMSIDLVEAW